MSKLLINKPKEIGNILIKNRLVRSATFTRMASEDGSVNNELVEFYKVLAKGGVGLIVTGLSYVHPSGHGYPNQIGIDRDDLIPGLKRIANTIHENGDGCKTAIQLAHSGRQSMMIGLESIAPSAILEPMSNNMPRKMTIDEIKEVIIAFAEAARRGKEAGFDAIQLHAAHGYLLSEFLSPHTNKRKDEYGGSIENRMRIITEIYNKTVKRVGKDFPIMIKINADDYLEDGIKIHESMKIASILSKMGFAAIEISGAMWEVALKSKEELGWMPAMIPESRVDILSKSKEAYHLPYAKEIKPVINKPLILVGGLRSLDVIEKILKEGYADFIALSRPLIREPDLPNKWFKGIGELKSECISCNGCVGSILQGKIQCIQKK